MSRPIPGARSTGGGATSFTVWAPRPERSRCTCSTGRAPPASSRGRRLVRRGARRGGARPALPLPPGWRRRGRPTRPRPLQPDGVHGPRRSSTPRFAWTDGALAGRAAGRPGALRAARRHVHPGGHLRRDRPAGSPSWLELGVTAIELMPVAEFPGAPQLGLRRRVPVRRADDLRRPRRAEAAGRRLPRARPRRRASTSSTTTSAPRATTSASSAPTSPTATARRGATPSTSTARAATRCAGFLVGERPDWLERVPRRRAAARRGPRASSTRSAVHRPRPSWPTPCEALAARVWAGRCT